MTEQTFKQLFMLEWGFKNIPTPAGAHVPCITLQFVTQREDGYDKSVEVFEREDKMLQMLEHICKEIRSKRPDGTATK